MGQELTSLTICIYVGFVVLCFACGALRQNPQQKTVNRSSDLRKVVILVNMLALLPVFLVALRPTYFLVGLSELRTERIGSFVSFVIVPVILAVLSALGLASGLLQSSGELRWRRTIIAMLAFILLISFYEWTGGMIRGEIYCSYCLPTSSYGMFSTHELRIFDRLPDWDFPCRCSTVLMLLLCPARYLCPKCRQPIGKRQSKDGQCHHCATPPAFDRSVVNAEDGDELPEQPLTSKATLVARRASGWVWRC